MNHWFKRLHGSDSDDDWLYVGTMSMADLIEQLHDAIEKSRDGNPMHIVVCTWHEFVVVSDHEFVLHEQFLNGHREAHTYKAFPDCVDPNGV